MTTPAAHLNWLAAALLLAACAGGAARKDDPGLEYNPEAARLNAELGARYLRQGNPERAIPKLERALQQAPGLPGVHASLGEAYAAIGEHDKATAHFRRALRLAPREVEVLSRYGVFLCGRRQYAEALQLLYNAATAPRIERREVAWTTAGVCARKAGDAQRAEQYLRQAIKENPRYPDAILHLGLLQLAQRQPRAALLAAARYRTLAGDTPQGLLLGMNAARQAGDGRQAGDYAQALRQRFPGVWQQHTNSEALGNGS